MDMRGMTETFAVPVAPVAGWGEPITPLRDDAVKCGRMIRAEPIEHQTAGRCAQELADAVAAWAATRTTRSEERMIECLRRYQRASGRVDL